MELNDPTQRICMEAPAASQSQHLERNLALDNALSRLRLASEIALREVDATQGLDKLYPRQAEAVARMLIEAQHSGAEAEFIWTPRDVGIHSFQSFSKRWGALRVGSRPPKWQLRSQWNALKSTPQRFLKPIL